MLSGLLWSGNPATIIESARIGRILLFTSGELLDELDGVLRRLKFSRRLAFAGLSVDAALALYRDLATVVVPVPVGLPDLRDPDDLAVLACAVAASADIIVTGDADLLHLKTYESIAIMTARDLVRTLGC